MSSRLTVLEYVSYITPFSNQPINLRILLSPFEIFGASSLEGTILVGEFLDELTSKVDSYSLINISNIIDILLQLETAGWFSGLLFEQILKENDKLIGTQNIYSSYF